MVPSMANPASRLVAVEPPEPQEAASAPEPQRVRHVGLQGIAIVVLAVIASVAALRAAEGFIIPILLAIVIALALAPVVRVVSRWLPRSVSSALSSRVPVIVSLTAYSLADDAAAAAANCRNESTVPPGVARRHRESAGPCASQIQRATGAGTCGDGVDENDEVVAIPNGVTRCRSSNHRSTCGACSGLGRAGCRPRRPTRDRLFFTYFLLSFGTSSSGSW